MVFRIFSWFIERKNGRKNRKGSKNMPDQKDIEQYQLVVEEETKLIKELNSLSNRLAFIRTRRTELEDQLFVKTILKNWSHCPEKLRSGSGANDSPHPQIRKKKQD